MKIGTWNTRTALGPHRARLLRNMSYDIWALQECEAQPDLGNMYQESLVATNEETKNLVTACRWPLSDRCDAPGGNAFACVVDGLTPFVFGNLWSFNDKAHPEARPCDYFNWYSCARRMVDFCIEYADEKRLPLIVAGDFNASLAHKNAAKYSKDYLEDSFSLWEQRGLVSAYHTHMQDRLHGDNLAMELQRETFGNETQPTVFGTNHGGWEYHVDYIFSQRSFVRPVVVRTFDRLRSDHAPVLATFEIV